MTLADKYEYVMHGRVYRFEHQKDTKVQVRERERERCLLSPLFLHFVWYSAPVGCSSLAALLCSDVLNPVRGEVSFQFDLRTYVKVMPNVTHIFCRR